MEIAAAISSFLTHAKVEKGLSPNTVSAYRRDLMKFCEFAQRRGSGDRLQIQSSCVPKM